MPANAAEAAREALSAAADVALVAGDILVLPEARLLGLGLGTAYATCRPPLLATVLGLAAVPLGLPAAASSAALTASILLPSMLLLPKALGYSIVLRLML